MSTLGKTGKIVTWDKFRDKFNIYILNSLRHEQIIVCIATDIEDTATAFEARRVHKDSKEEK